MEFRVRAGWVLVTDWMTVVVVVLGLGGVFVVLLVKVPVCRVACTGLGWKSWTWTSERLHLRVRVVVRFLSLVPVILQLF